jgi:hypothetical protein
MANRYEICIVIPVFNEANTLAALIGKTQALKLVKRRSSSSTMVPRMAAPRSPCARRKGGLLSY